MTANRVLERALSEVESADDAPRPDSYGARLRRHFDQWRYVQGGQLVEPDLLLETPSQRSIVAVLRGAIFEEDRADALVLLPPELRAQRLAAESDALDVTEKDFVEILRWWRDCGRKVPR